MEVRERIPIIGEINEIETRGKGERSRVEKIATLIKHGIIQLPALLPRQVLPPAECIPLWGLVCHW